MVPVKLNKLATHFASLCAPRERNEYLINPRHNERLHFRVVEGSAVSGVEVKRFRCETWANLCAALCPNFDCNLQCFHAKISAVWRKLFAP